MKKLVIISMLLCLVQMVPAQSLKKIWEVQTLEAPESVVHYNGAYYVSNVSGQPAEKNGKGFITKLDTKGEIIELKWLEGFNAPKGLGIFENHLYVADIDRVGLVNLDTGEIEKWYTAEGATFLNDIEIGPTGTVYVSDTFGGNAIYKIEQDAIELLVKDEKLDYPNGLKLDGDLLYVATWGVVTNPETFGTDVPGVLLALHLKNKSIKNITKSFGNLDGLVRYENGFIVSDWISGAISFIDSNGDVTALEQINPGTADIAYLKKENVLLVPRMLDGKLTAYEVSDN
ncbi:SMP-30/gluconolactonase/LRE family protein [Flagellimonas sp.]|uniref:SMP-30/gluconolactonase/LRE family protein n=1 Tax=Flagellimonas sp. TaxID=2058762 RepID=UPI003F4A0DCC